MSSITTTAIGSKFVPTTDLNIEADAEAREAVRALKQARADKADAEKRERAAKAAINALRGDKTRLFVRGFVVLKVDAIERTDLDRDVLKVAFPEAFEAAQVTSTYDKITVL